MSGGPTAGEQAQEEGVRRAELMMVVVMRADDGLVMVMGDTDCKAIAPPLPVAMLPSYEQSSTVIGVERM